MGIPAMFNDIIKKHLNVNAAWLPVTNSFKLGDYGLISDGVFVPMGNIKEFNVTFTEATGPDASIDFTSANTTVVKFAAGVEVNVIPAGALNAKITFKFNDEKSFLVKAPVIKLNQIENVKQVATKLRDTRKWGRKWKVVHQVYSAFDPLIVSTITGGTELTVSGDTEAIKNWKIGDASVELGTTKELGLKVNGKEGVIGLGLFKLKLFGNDPGFLSDDEKTLPVEIEILNNSSPEEKDL